MENTQHVGAASSILETFLHLIHPGVCPQAFAYCEPALHAQEDSNVHACFGQTILMRSGSPSGPGRSSGASHMSHS